MIQGGAVYIMTNKNKTTLYIGVSSDLISRIHEHKTKRYPNSFTSRYKLFNCIYFEGFATIEDAIGREKELKKWNRLKKEKLINSFNPAWLDLSEIINQLF